MIAWNLYQCVYGVSSVMHVCCLDGNISCTWINENMPWNFISNACTFYMFLKSKCWLQSNWSLLESIDHSNMIHNSTSERATCCHCMKYNSIKLIFHILWASHLFNMSQKFRNMVQSLNQVAFNFSWDQLYWSFASESHNWC